MEIWRKTQLDPDFEISSLGNVRKSNGHSRGKWMTNHGYMQTEFKNKKKYAVHRLVGWAFLNEAYFEGAVINHKNGIKTDNRVENLEWVTISENAKHAFRIGLNSIIGERHPSSILTEKQVIDIREKRKNGFKIKDIASIYNVNPQTISSVTTRQTWTHI